jgi:hypothetical protein
VLLLLLLPPPLLELEPLSLLLQLSPIELSLVSLGATQNPSRASQDSPSQQDASSMHHRSSASTGTHSGTHAGSPMPARPLPAPAS